MGVNVDDKQYKQFALLDFKDAGVSKTKDDQQLGNFSGYASTWTKDSYGDVIAPGAFAQSIKDKGGKYPIFANHEENKQVGFATSMAEDHKGLRMSAALALDTSAGADTYALLKAADAVDFRMGLSIGFVATEWDDEGDSRVLKTIDLWEVSITPFPANKRAYVDDLKSFRLFEKRLRDVGGFSVTESKRILAALTAAQPLAPVRDVREVRTQPIAPTGIREDLWPHLRLQL